MFSQFNNIILPSIAISKILRTRRQTMSSAVIYLFYNDGRLKMFNIYYEFMVVLIRSMKNLLISGYFYRV